MRKTTIQNKRHNDNRARKKMRRRSWVNEVRRDYSDFMKRVKPLFRRPMKHSLMPKP